MDHFIKFSSFIFKFIIIIPLIQSLTISTIRSNNSDDKYESKQINYTSHQQVLINKDLLIMNNTSVELNGLSSFHDFLIATQINNSWISATEKGPWKKYFKNCKNQCNNAKVGEKDRFVIIKEALFNDSCQVNKFEFNMTLLMSTNFLMINSYFKFDGFMSLNQIAKANKSKEDNKNNYYNAIILKNGNIMINENYNEINQIKEKENNQNQREEEIDKAKAESEAKKEEESDHQLETQLQSEPRKQYIKFIKCDMIPSIYWSCNGSYIFFGDEYDIYLIRQLNKTLVFDSLSYYSLVPLDEWNYFKKEYFGKNEDCTNVLIPNSEPRMYYIQCSKLKTYQKDKRKIINFIIANYSTQYGEVFDEVLYLNNYTAPYLDASNETVIYFNFLFCDQLDHWVLGGHFFRNKTIGFDYQLKQTLIEIIPEKSFNFTQYFTPKESDFKLWLFIGTSIIAVIIFLISGILNWRSRRQLDKQFKEITKSELIQQQQAQEDELIEDERDISFNRNINNTPCNKVGNGHFEKNEEEESDIDLIEEDPKDEEISIAKKPNQ